jgi:hypothetical protein
MKDKEKWKGEENTVTRICPRVPRFLDYCRKRKAFGKYYD